MPAFSPRSLARLATCDPDLRVLFETVIEERDCTILCGARGEEEQTETYRTGRSKVSWPDSKHNAGPGAPRDLADAVDVLPYPIDWSDRERICLFAGYVLGVAAMLRADGLMDRRVRWGGDWDRDGMTLDERFFDGPHFELID